MHVKINTQGAVSSYIYEHVKSCRFETPLSDRVVQHPRYEGACEPINHPSQEHNVLFLCK